MRNKYAGICYKCGAEVAVGEGFFERHKGQWRTQHNHCLSIAEPLADKQTEI